MPAAAYPECLLPPLEPRAWVVVCNGAESFARIGEREGFALDSVAEGEPPVALQLSVDAARDAGQPPERIVLRPAPGRYLARRRALVRSARSTGPVRRAVELDAERGEAGPRSPPG